MYEDFEVISTYTRAQAIEDGTLIALGRFAERHGVRWPVAVTPAALACSQSWIHNDEPSDEERMDDIGAALAQELRAKKRLGDEVKVGEKVKLPRLFARVDGELAPAPVVYIIGPGDSGEPVITVTLEDED
ncbi:MAG: hypothetical protein H6827_09665 [Planctomycetes bacterium]|nr:hypothetical protein [Planctomycetota bacterium]